MQTDEFIAQVVAATGLSPREAMEATRATLSTLGAHLAGGEAHDLAAQLPRALGRYVDRDRHVRGERFSLSEFIQRVAEREGVDVIAAARHARAVIVVLEAAVSAGEIKDVMAQLPPDFRALFFPEAR